MRKLGEQKDIGKRMPRPKEQGRFCSKADGYLGTWHSQVEKFPHGWKYSGGLGTYCSSHAPFAVYAPEVDRTYFCWGGMDRDKTKVPRNWDFCTGHQLHMVSYYDHKTGTVPKPTLIFDKYVCDAHDNPVISIDSKGYIWIFSPSHGQWTTPSFIHRSTAPYSIDSFDTIEESLFAYPQPWWTERYGFLFFHTRYQDGRMVHLQRSSDGRRWEKPLPLACIEQGHYYVSNQTGDTSGLALNYHPAIGGLEARTNLYYMKSTDGGGSWTSADGSPIATPLKEIRNPALVRDYKAEGLLVYLMDIVHTSQGYPVLLYLTSKSHVTGPDSGPRIWTMAQWNGSGWEYSVVTGSNSNYDCGAILLGKDGLMSIIGPTEDGPRPWGPGGEIALWISRDHGRTWAKEREITKGSPVNHTYVRRVLGGKDDFAVFWADGDTELFDDSFLYFAHRDGKKAYRLPPLMTQDSAAPEEV